MSNFDQLAILVFSAAAVWLVGRREKWKRWGYVAGLCSQPFYLWATWEAGQWGMFALCWWYAYSWSQGIWNYWINVGDDC